VAVFAAAAQFGQGAVVGAGAAGALGRVEAIQISCGELHDSGLRRSQEQD